MIEDQKTYQANLTSKINEDQIIINELKEKLTEATAERDEL